MRKAKRPDAQKVRATVEAFDRETVYALMAAANTQAAVLASLDATFPNPDARTMIVTLAAAADQLYSANATRDYLEGDERFQPTT